MKNFIKLIIFIGLIIFPSPLFVNALGVKEFTKEKLRKLQSERVESYLNRSVNPCNDFYEFACGNWSQNVKIPSYYQNEALAEIPVKIDAGIKNMLLTNRKDDSDFEQKIKEFFKICMNHISDKDDLVSQATDFLIKLADGEWPFVQSNGSKKSTKFNWFKVFTHFITFGVNPLVTVTTTTSKEDSNKSIIILVPSGYDHLSYDQLTRDVCLFECDSYFNHVMWAFQRFSSSAQWSDLMEMVSFERQRAEILEKYDPNKLENYTIFDFYDFKLEFSEFNGLDWDYFFETVIGKKMRNTDKVNVKGWKYFSPIMKLIATTEPRVLANFFLSRFVFEHMELFNVRNQFEDDDQCANHVRNVMTLVVGLSYMRRNYDMEMRDNLNEIVVELKASYRNILNEMIWLEEPTRRELVRKLEKIYIFYDYDEMEFLERLGSLYVKELKFDDNNLIRSFFAAKGLSFRFLFKDITDNKKFVMQNLAYKMFSSKMLSFNNYFYIPATLYQLPLFHKLLSKSLNYGAIGTKIGQELSFSFILKNFPQSYDNQSTQCLIDQFSEYTVLEFIKYKIKVDGKASLHNNIALQGGVKSALLAYKKQLKLLQKHQYIARKNFIHENLPNLEFSPMQLFFLSFAQLHCNHIPMTSVDDKRIPEKFKVIGTLANFQEFADEFKCPIGSPMNPKNKCIFW